MKGILLFLCLFAFIGASCEEHERPWHKDVYVYDNEDQMMRNVVDARKDKPASQGHGFFCVSLQTYNQINNYMTTLEDDLERCQSQKTNPQE